MVTTELKSQLLALLAGGQMTTSQLIKLTGAYAQDVSNALSSLRSRGAVEFVGYINRKPDAKGGGDRVWKRPAQLNLK